MHFKGLFTESTIINSVNTWEDVQISPYMYLYMINVILSCLHSSKIPKIWPSWYGFNRGNWNKCITDQNNFKSIYQVCVHT